MHICIFICIFIFTACIPADSSHDPRSLQLHAYAYHYSTGPGIVGRVCRDAGCENEEAIVTKDRMWAGLVLLGPWNRCCWDRGISAARTVGSVLLGLWDQCCWDHPSSGAPCLCVVLLNWNCPTVPTSQHTTVPVPTSQSPAWTIPVPVLLGPSQFSVLFGPTGTGWDCRSAGYHMLMYSFK